MSATTVQPCEGDRLLQEIRNSIVGLEIALDALADIAARGDEAARERATDALRHIRSLMESGYRSVPDSPEARAERAADEWAAPTGPRNQPEPSDPRKLPPATWTLRSGPEHLNRMDDALGEGRR
jgi:hypothetical protein